MSTSEDFQKDYKEFLSKLEQQREEARVQIHLASMEADEAWQGLEKKWSHLIAMNKRYEAEAEEVGEDIRKSLVDLGHEIGKGYKRLTDLL